jgi:hypothetical protein
VFDPQNHEEGLFAWRTGNMLIESFVVQKDAQPSAKVARRVPDFPPNAPGIAANLPGIAGNAATDAPAAPHAQTHAHSHAHSQAHTTHAVAATPAPFAFDHAPAEHVEPAERTEHAEAAEAAPAPASQIRSHAIAAAIAGPRAAQNAEVTELALRIQMLERRQRWYTVGMALIVLVAIAWPVVFSAIATLQAPDDSLTAPPPATAATPARRTDPSADRNSKPIEEAAVMNAASVETDPEARP